MIFKKFIRINGDKNASKKGLGLNGAPHSSEKGCCKK